MTAVLFGVLAAMCWAVHDLLARSTAPRVGPMHMGLWIMLASGAMLTAIVAWRGTLLEATPEGLVWALALGVTYGAGAAGIYKAFSLGPVSIVGPLTSAYPVLVVVWGIFNGLAPTSLQWFAVAAAIGGGILVARAGPPDGGLNAVAPGKIATLFFACAISMLGYAAAVVVGQSAAVMIGAIEAAWISRATAVVIFLMLMTGETRPEPIRGRLWWPVLGMSVLDAGGLIAVNEAGHYPGKEFAAVGISGYGAMSVVLAAMVLKERVSPLQWLGIAMIVGGVAALSLPQ